MDFNEFIKEYEFHDPNVLRLSLDKKKFDFDLDLALIQIECRKKHRSKFKNFIQDNTFLFPEGLSAEQASHQAIARFHASLVGTNNKVLDISAGLGIDSFSFSMENNSVTAIELNSRKADFLKLNAKNLGLQNITVINTDSILYLKETSGHFNIIFADPARRDSSNQRLHNLRDCSPDVIGNLDLLKNKGDKIFIKASPLLDIVQTVKDFSDVIAVRAVGVKGECKEILIEIDSEMSKLSPGQLVLEAVNLDEEGIINSSFSVKGIVPDIFQKLINNEEYALVEDLKPGAYILEPSAMLMKIAPWPEIITKFKAKKFGKSSNVFITEEKPVDFPGRVTQLIKIIKKQDRKSLEGFPASVVSRNYPLSSETLRKSLKLKEGDNHFVYGTKVEDKPILLLTKR